MEALNGDSRSLVVVETYFADLGFTDAAERQAKRRLAYALNQLLEARKLSEADAAKMVGVTEAKVSAFRNYQLADFSFEQLVKLLSVLGQDSRSY